MKHAVEVSQRDTLVEEEMRRVQNELLVTQVAHLCDVKRRALEKRMEHTPVSTPKATRVRVVGP